MHHFRRYALYFHLLFLASPSLTLWPDQHEWRVCPNTHGLIVAWHEFVSTLPGLIIACDETSLYTLGLIIACDESTPHSPRLDHRVWQSGSTFTGMTIALDESAQFLHPIASYYTPRTRKRLCGRRNDHTANWKILNWSYCYMCCYSAFFIGYFTFWGHAYYL